MAFNLPIYKIVGVRPIKMEKAKGGGSLLSAWDWDENDFVQGGERAALSGYESPERGADSLDPDTPLLGGADSRSVTKAEFEAYVETLKKR